MAFTQRAFAKRNEKKETFFIVFDFCGAKIHPFMQPHVELFPKKVEREKKRGNKARKKGEKQRFSPYSA